MNRRRYAQGTTVEVGKTKTELDVLLAKHGATQRAVFQDDEQGRACIQFRIAERMVRLEVKVPRFERDKRKQAQREREAWRRLLLVTKAKLELVADGASTFEREFLADILLPDGQTVHEAMREGLADAYLSGKMPPLLPGPSQ